MGQASTQTPLQAAATVARVFSGVIVPEPKNTPLTGQSERGEQRRLWLPRGQLTILESGSRLRTAGRGTLAGGKKN